MSPKRLAEYGKLSTPERILVLQDLWDEIAADPRTVPVSDDQRAELDRRLSRKGKVSDNASSWPEAKRRIRATK